MQRSKMESHGKVERHAAFIHITLSSHEWKYHGNSRTLGRAPSVCRACTDHKQSSSLNAPHLQDTPTFDFLPAGSNTTTQRDIQQNGTV
jgi:hypothetical protein